MLTAAATYQDVIYGEITVTHPVALRLIGSPAMQRLRDIDMAGYSSGFYPDSRHTRFEHSLGVFHLLTSHGARTEECLHGLLHDVSHTVFSHAVDYAVEGGSGKTQDFQDRIFSQFLATTTIPTLLKDAGLDPDVVFDETKYPLQENQLPELCADRLDYAFRGFYHYRILPLPVVHALLANLRNDGKQWFFANQVAAQDFGAAFAKLDDEVFDSLRSAAMFRSVGDCVKYALNHNVLTMEDLFTTDTEALLKIRSGLAGNPKLGLLWKRMNGLVRFENNPDAYETVVHCKSRIVDPKFDSGGTVEPLSTVSEEWKETVRAGLKPKTYFLRFLD